MWNMQGLCKSKNGIRVVIEADWVTSCVRNWPNCMKSRFNVEWGRSASWIRSLEIVLGFDNGPPVTDVNLWKWNRAHFEILQEGKMNRMALPWPPDTIFVAWWQQSLPKKQFISCYFQWLTLTELRIPLFYQLFNHKENIHWWASCTPCTFFRIRIIAFSINVPVAWCFWWAKWKLIADILQCSASHRCINFTQLKVFFWHILPAKQITSNV